MKGLPSSFTWLRARALLIALQICLLIPLSGCFFFRDLGFTEGTRPGDELEQPERINQVPGEDGNLVLAPPPPPGGQNAPPPPPPNYVPFVPPGYIGDPEAVELEILSDRAVVTAAPGAFLSLSEPTERLKIRLFRVGNASAASTLFSYFRFLRLDAVERVGSFYPLSDGSASVEMSLSETPAFYYVLTVSSDQLENEGVFEPASGNSNHSSYVIGIAWDAWDNVFDAQMAGASVRRGSP